MFNKNLFGLILIAAGVFFFRSYNQSNDSLPLAQKPSIITQAEENRKELNIPEKNSQRIFG